jgi:uncharacterized delta-60 repeat protein
LSVAPRLEVLEARLLPSLTPHLLKDINPGGASSQPFSIVGVNGITYFNANDGTHSDQQWKSNGSAGGTVMVTDIDASGLGLSPRQMCNVNGTLFFSGRNGVSGAELWKSNGTAAGTLMVKDIRPGSASSYPEYLTNVNGTLFFQATNGVSGPELWKSNGTAAGTVLVKDIRPGSVGSNPKYLANVNGMLFFDANNGVSGPELWKSNGTAPGTVLVKDIRPGSVGSNPKYLANVNGMLFFDADNGVSGPELWKSNGTAPGTVLIKDINPGANGSYPGSLANVNGTLLFSANNGVSGQELWKSNGTAAGTILVKDISPGSASSYPRALTNVNGTLFFAALNLATGTELWRSSGTGPGTALVKDIDSGAAGSNPRYLTNVNGTLFFSANDGVHGFEPWVMGPVPAAMSAPAVANSVTFLPAPEVAVSVAGPQGVSGGALATSTAPSGGVLDPTFGSGGLVNTPSNSNTGAHAIATYPNEGTANDGKIAAVWVAFSSNGTPYMAVARYNLNGTLDTNFGGTGEVTNFKGYARGVTVQPDGKVIVAGWEPRGNFAAIRYNANGSVDTSFGTKGEAIIQFGRSGSYAYNVALQADGKIVLAGEVNGDVGLARLNTNGSLDSSFGAGGQVSTPLPYSLSAPDYKFNVTNLAIDPNSNASDSNGGKLLVSAEWQLTNNTTVVLRYNSNGTLDTTFGGGAGYVNLTGTGRPAVVVQPDDRTVVATNDSGAVLLARLNADGTLDTSFGNGGTVLTLPPANSGVFADCLALQPNGQIVVGGNISSTAYGLMAARWNTNGTLDATFGNGGFAVASGSGQGAAVALEPDGRIVVAGNNIYSGGIELARFLPAGPQIGSFNAEPNPVSAGSSLTLTTSSITDANPGATITQVAFYVQINGTKTLLGYGTRTGTDVWTLTITVNLAPASYTLFAQAEDSYGVFGDPAALTLTVN